MPGITFYDLGRVKNESGDFVDLDFIFRFTFDSDGGSSADPTGNDVNTLRDPQIFAVSMEEWKVKFKKLSPPETRHFDYKLKLGSDDPVDIDDLEDAGGNKLWTESGLRLTDEQAAAGFTTSSADYLKPELFFTTFGGAKDALYNPLHLTPATINTYHKVTLTRVYTEPNVPLVLDRKSEIYLLPAFCGINLLGTYTESDGVHSRQQEVFIYRSVPRTLVFDASNQPKNGSGQADYVDRYPSPANHLLLKHAVRFHQTLDGWQSRTFRFHPPDSPEITINEYFLPDAVYPDAEPPPGTETSATLARNSIIYSQTLAAVIKTNNIFYYVWNK